MAFYTKTKIFIFPDRSKLLLFGEDGISNSDVDGSNKTYMIEGNYYSNYLYDQNTGFIYFMGLSDGYVYRNENAYDFTSFISVGNFFPGDPADYSRCGHIILANNGRIIFGYGGYLRYTDDLFNSSVDISIETSSNLYFLLYEGGNSILTYIYNGSSSSCEFYRSLDNGSTWQYQSVPFGMTTYNSFQDGYILNI